MKTNIFFTLIILLSLIGCNSPKVYTDYDETIDFTRFQTFGFYKNMDTGLDTLDQVRLKKAITTALTKKGFTTNDTPDFKINFYADFTKETNHNNLGISIGALGSHVGGNIASGIPIKSSRDVMEITIELVDAKTNTLYWQGVSENKLHKNTTPEERSKFFSIIVQKTLEKYPPK